MKTPYDRAFHRFVGGRDELLDDDGFSVYGEWERMDEDYVEPCELIAVLYVEGVVLTAPLDFDRLDTRTREILREHATAAEKSHVSMELACYPDPKDYRR